MTKIYGGRLARRTTLAEQTYEALREQIVDQKLPPGTRLNIDALVREMEVSSSPIREALVRLEAERLIVSELYSGYSVAPHPTAEYLAALLDYRILVESHCAYIGARRRSPQVISGLKKELQRMSVAPRIGQHYLEFKKFVAADAKFHQILVDSARNPVISDTYNSLHIQVVQSRLYMRRSEGGSSATVGKEHAAILSGFERGDGEAAAKAVKAHLEGGRARLIPLAHEESADVTDACSTKPLPATRRRRG